MERVSIRDDMNGGSSLNLFASHRRGLWVTVSDASPTSGAHVAVMHLDRDGAALLRDALDVFLTEVTA